MQINVIVVSSDPATAYKQRQVQGDVTFHLCSFDRLALSLRQMKNRPLRVAQSDILNLIRLGVPVPELGHPELNNALAYIERCHRSIDAELFRAFTPTGERWAINGSAGMGKSVLLAYSLFVLTTNRRVEIKNGQRSLIDFSTEATAISLPPLGQRGVYTFALKEKQRLVLAGLHRRFLDEFAPLSKDVDLGVSRPAILLWSGRIPGRCKTLSVNCLSSFRHHPSGVRRSEGERSEPSAAESRRGDDAPRAENWSRAGHVGSLLGCRQTHPTSKTTWPTTPILTS